MEHVADIWTDDWYRTMSAEFRALIFDELFESEPGVNI